MADEVGLGPGVRLERDILALPEAFLGATGRVAQAVQGSWYPPVSSGRLRPLSKAYSDEEVKIFDPPKVPQRSLAEDYPDGVELAASGKLKRDIDGRPLNDNAFIVGRANLGRRNRKGDVPLRLDATEKLITRLLGFEPSPRSPEAMRSMQDGVYDSTKRNFGTTHYVNGKPEIVYYDMQLTPGQKLRVLAHELGHVLADIPDVKRSIEPLREQFAKIYHIGDTGKIPEGKLTSPLDNDYKPHQVDGELLAEAFRMYMLNPNFIKKEFPETAAWIRAHVNEHPKLRDKIQFNALGGTLMGSAGLRPLMETGEEPNDEQY